MSQEEEQGSLLDIETTYRPPTVKQLSFIAHRLLERGLRLRAKHSDEHLLEVAEIRAVRDGAEWVIYRDLLKAELRKDPPK